MKVSKSMCGRLVREAGVEPAWVSHWILSPARPASSATLAPYIFASSTEYYAWPPIRSPVGRFLRGRFRGRCCLPERGPLRDGLGQIALAHDGVPRVHRLRHVSRQLHRLRPWHGCSLQSTHRQCAASRETTAPPPPPGTPGSTLRESPDGPAAAVEHVRDDSCPASAAERRSAHAARAAAWRAPASGRRERCAPGGSSSFPAPAAPSAPRSPPASTATPSLRPCASR